MIPHWSLLISAGALLACFGCGARSALLEESAETTQTPTVVEPGACANWSAWTDVAPGATPTSPESPDIACAKTCQERGSARITIVCDGYPGALSSCFCLVGEPRHPDKDFGYATCWVTALHDYDDNDAGACGRRFAEDPAGVISECRSEAASTECAPAP